MSQAGQYNTGGVVPPGTAVVTITGNTGGAVPPDGAGNINLVTQNTTVDVAGIPVSNLLTINFGISNLVLGDDLSFLTTGVRNVGLGLSVLNATTSGSDNTALGFGAGTSMAGASNANTVVGSLALDALTLGSSNAAFGADSLSGLTAGNQNTAIGTNALNVLQTGSYNTILGYGSGSAYNAAQSSNILIANTGYVADSNTIRIGNQGNGAGQQNRNFQAGIYNVTPAVASPKPVVIDSAGQLGTDSGSGILLTLTGNTGGAIAPVAGNINIVNANTTVDIAGSAGQLTQDFGITNLILGSDASSIAGAIRNVGVGFDVLNDITTGSSNSAMGYQAAHNLTTGNANIAIGDSALASETTGGSNIAIGNGALGLSVGGNANIAIGRTSLGTNITGRFNTMVGYEAGINIASDSNTGVGYNALSGGIATTYQYNTAIGWNAGQAFTTSDSNNICINNQGILGNNNTLRIGAATGTGNQELNRAFICGIDGVNVGSVAKVVTMASDQLGTATITAGTGITVTPGANTIEISSTGADLLAYTNVNSSPYVVLTTDEFLGVDCSGGIITVQLPNAPSTGRVFIIKDRTGNANINNITVTTVGGAVNIDGATTYVMNTQYASIQVLFNGSTYQIF